MNKIFLDKIIAIISQLPKGASLEELMVGLEEKITRRTLQRRLSTLVRENKLITEGKARALRYKLASASSENLLYSGPIPLSKDGSEIYTHVTQPIQKRKPVSYHREFLEDYQPNQTYYLPAEMRKRLALLNRNREGKYPAGTYARKIFHRLLIDLSWNSSRLEGNTYSILETERLLDFGKAAQGKNLIETQMILNHKAAIEFLLQSSQEIGVNRYTILNLHTLLSDNLLPDPSACGRLRFFPVGIEKSTYLPLEIPQIIEECFQLLINKASIIKDPFEQAFFLMVQLPYLQAFDDVNKRTSRLALNLPLFKNNLCPLSFIDMPQEIYISGLLGVYELNRVELLRDVFMWAYERSCLLYSATKQTVGEPNAFRMRYRSHITQLIQTIIQSQLNKEEATKKIRIFSQTIDPVDQLRFIEITERELQSLHEGNIARYSITPRDFDNWKQNWK